MKQQIQTLKQEVPAMRDQATDLSEQVSTLQSKNKKSESKVCSLSEKLGKGGECARYKSYSEYSESHRRRLKWANSEHCQDSLLWFQQDSYTPLAVELKKH